MKTILLAAIMLIGSAAFADGFLCENQEQNLRLKVFNQVDPEQGTRNAAVMIVSDLSVADGHKTTASFDAENSLVTNEGSRYTALVDLRYRHSNLAGRNIAGTKFGNVKYIVLDIDFRYSRPVDNGDEMNGEMILTRRSGDELRVDVTCIRYLKSDR